MRITFKSYALGHVDTVTDDWNTVAPDEEPHFWTDTTTFLTGGRPADPETDVQPEHCRKESKHESLTWHHHGLGMETNLRCRFTWTVPLLCGELTGSGEGRTQLVACTWSTVMVSDSPNPRRFEKSDGS